MKILILVFLAVSHDQCRGITSEKPIYTCESFVKMSSKK
ncbi:hypothetical protein rpr22_0895 [Rickettsia prowazekii str. Rp22]|uniref:Uncharacterized protein n=1 Tax=Rickettsia prowazekii (strain Rp22) TaxID=449216 RepID=D5AYB6_RICPP|nr:hypothetical protein rpr22_0895 [Rickettsia prowazekii str. Rp22]